MRITKRQLKRIIREEYSKIKQEQRLSESRRSRLRESTEITKEQLKQIIREEYSRIKRERRR